MANKKAEKIPDPIVGEVSGNVLDEYSSYSYSAKLYMIPPLTNTPPSGVKSAKDPAPATGLRGAAAAVGRASGGAAGGSKGGYLNDYFVADPTETVVLAQTGVTAGNQIDNLSIENINM